MEASTMEATLNNIKLNFNAESLTVLNLCLAFIMFGVAITLKASHFREVINNPRGIVTGIVSQYLMLPAVTFLLVWLLRPYPALALGMILVAACPGGNVSNFYTMVAGGNVALSVSLTGVATLVAAFMTPFNFSFWGSQLDETRMILTQIELSFWQMARTVILILILPLIGGLWFKWKYPQTAIRISKPVKVISMFMLAAFILFAFANNFQVFLDYFHLIVLIVFLHNGIALLLGYLLGKLARNSDKDTRAISIETGIQNSALGLLIIFSFFNGNGGMAIIAAWWGIWHLISGFIMARLFNFMPVTSQS